MGDRDGITENEFLKKQSVKHQREPNPRLGYINQTATFNIRNAIHTGSKKRHFMVVLLPLSCYCIGSLHSNIKWYVNSI